MGSLNFYLRENGYRLAGRVYLFLGFIFLLLPIAFLILFSFQKNVYSSLPLQGWTLQWYDKLVYDGVLFDALLNSLKVSPIAATAASVIGFLAAYALNRFVFPGRILTATILILPILIPPLILGVSLLGLLSRLGLHGELYSVIIAHTLLLTAPAMAIIQLRLAQMPPTLEEAALGSRRKRAPDRLARGAALGAARHRRRLAAGLHLLVSTSSSSPGSSRASTRPCRSPSTT